MDLSDYRKHMKSITFSKIDCVPNNPVQLVYGLILFVLTDVKPKTKNFNVTLVNYI